MKFFLKKEFILFLLVGIGIFFRIYNLNFENLWYDEIISFWVANPSFSYSETNSIHNQIETTSILYNVILKSFYQIFGYRFMEVEFYLLFLEYLVFFQLFILTGL